MNGLGKGSMILGSIAEATCVLQSGAGGGGAKGLCLSAAASGGLASSNEEIRAFNASGADFTMCCS